ncbi:MAG: diguanylate cyclase [Spirochaetes bacterium]|nr:MAG: diguanylate cyclase [Spirochaetota bacterium]
MRQEYHEREAPGRRFYKKYGIRAHYKENAEYSHIMVSTRGIYILFCVLSLGVSLSLAWYCIGRRREPGALCYGAVSLFQALWITGTLLDLLATTIQHKLSWDLLQYAGGAGWAVFLWHFAAVTASARIKPPRPLSLLIALPAIAGILFMATDPFHGLARIDPRLESREGGLFLIYEFSPLAIIAAACVLLVLLHALLILLRAFIRMHHLYRRQVGFVIAGHAIPLLGAAVTLAALCDFPLRDISPFTITTGGLLAAWGLVRYRHFDTIPMARDLLIETMDDAVIVLDDNARVLDYNKAASDICAANGGLMIGADVGTMCPGMSEALPADLAPGGIRRDVVLETPRGPAHFEMKSWDLSPSGNVVQGRLLVLRDISERKNMELELRKSHDLLLARLDRAKALQEKLEEMAMRDPLTGLFNRYFLDEVFAKELVRAERSNETVGCILLDIDFFKIVNDEYGHQTGDLILKALGDIMREFTRKSDITCRYGGEEFLIIMPGAREEIVLDRAEAVRSHFAAVRSRSGGHSIKATLSGGISMYPRHASDHTALIRIADKALYRAKRAGRNVVLIAEDSEISADQG